MKTRHRVLVADDHDVVRLGLKTMINAEPALEVVGEAETGPEAVAMFLELKPDIGVIDLLLPGCDGAAVCAALRRELPAARVLILSGASGSEHIHQAFQAGAMGYLLKASPRAALIAAMHEVLAGRRVVPPDVAQRWAERAFRPDLSPRERDVLAEVMEGRTNREIARRLGLGEATVKTHIERILAKLGVEDRTQAALAAMTRGIIRSR